MRHMTTVVDPLKRAVRYARLELERSLWLEDAVVASPDDQRLLRHARDLARDDKSSAL